MSQIQVFSGESISPAPEVTKTIKVRRAKVVVGRGVGRGAGRGAGCGAGGIEAFDAFLAKSGLEPKTYQREGVEFCLRRERVGCGGVGGGVAGNVFGGIIADEMGLGKTIVMIGLILANLVAIHRTLIVVPVALISQWVAQLKKNVIDSGFKPDLTIAVYHGASRRRIICCGGGGGKWHLMPDRRRRGGGGGVGGDRPIDIVITTYGSVALEVPASENSNAAAAAAKKPKRNALAVVTAKKAPRLSLLTFGAERVIFDEAHHMRNKKSRIFRGAMKLLGRCGSGYDRSSGSGGDVGDVGGISSSSSQVRVWNVTGTPIQNKISDLKSLCYILGFSPAEVIRSEQREFIRDNYVLRRTKMSVGMIAAPGSGIVAGATEGADVAGATGGALKSLEHTNSNVSWGNENELQLSREIHTRARNTSDRTERLKLYTRMRQMCVWPALISSGALLRPVAAGKESLAAAAAAVVDDTYDLPVEQYKNALSHQSKLDRVVDIINQELATDPARKSIVFCHFRREMTRIRELLLLSVRSGSGGGGGSGAGLSGLEIIDGSVSGTQRNRILAASPQILLLQIRTCSEGLNLQAYTDVYFVSPHWNPCVEDQAIARCFRIGQTAQVRVFRFYMSDFIVDKLSIEGEAAAAGGAIGGAMGGAGSAVGSGDSGANSNISTLDHKCEETQERKRALCNEFLEGGRADINVA